jgi:two-component system CheB/CheR fusion protein
VTAGSDADFGALLAHIRDARGYDFTGYKPSSLQRRLQKRMELLGVETYEAYRDLLEVQPTEFAALFDTLLINVTGFFRDPEAWEALRQEAISELLESRTDEGQIRAWSAGTASGEEAYTLAMLLAEALGEDAYLQRVKIYATDVDDRALEEARHALYEPSALEAVPEDLRERYFEPSNGRWCFRRDLRRTIIFGRNDLVRDAPISRIDLLVCRNTLMYFNSETQGDILRRFHFALQPTGLLFLGKSEMLLTRRDLFEPISLKRRLFRKVVHSGDRRGPVLVRPADRYPETPEQSAAVARRAFEASPAAQILIGRDRLLRLANDAARRLLRLGIPDVGRPLQDLEVSYRPVELRPALDVAFTEGRSVSLGPVRHRHDDREVTLELEVAPLPNGDEPALVSVTYLDVTARLGLEQELERAKRELGAAYEELQSTVEELETTNEELQSTNEELETTNEELQSTNEELETMNEELQSANEELETINEEMRQRSIWLDEANAVMEAILSSLGIGVLTVDRQERIHLWNEHSEELWGVRRDEALGARVTELDIGLPLDELHPTLRAALLDGGDATTFDVPARDRRGREFLCQVRIVPLKVDGGGQVAAVVLAQRRDGD